MPQGAPAQEDADLAEEANNGANSDLSVPAAAPQSGKLQPDQMQELMAALTKGPNIRQRIGTGLASLGSGIVQGVGRAGNPEFQQSALEQQKMQKEGLINALRQKYEANYKGVELGQNATRLQQEAAHNKATEALTAAGQKSENARAEEANKLKAQEIQQGGQKANVEAAKEVVDAYQKGNILGERPSRAAYESALKVIQSSGAPGAQMIRIKDSTGKMHDLPAANLSRAKQRDPGLVVVQ
jgi:hypothetical protein